MTSAQDYMDRIRQAAGTQLVTDTIYGGREGHLRFARECGVALRDFEPEERDDIIHSGYSTVYVRACFLKPILSAKEWVNEMLSSEKNDHTA